MSQVGIALATLAVSAAVGVTSIQQGRRAADKQVDASRAAARQSGLAEKARGRLAELDQRRKRRLATRNAIIARSDILQAAIGRGVGVGSSPIQGAIGAVTADQGQQIGDIGAVGGESRKIFAANEAAAVARGQFNVAGTQVAAAGQGLNLAGSILSNIGPISRVGANIGGFLR